VQLGLEGRVALVTGAAGGIGSAICRTLAAEGCDVALLDRDGAALAGLAADVEHAGRRALRLEADVTDFPAAEARVAETLDALGALDVLVCAAGITRDAMSWKMSETAWDDVIAVNLKGSFTYARAAAAVLRRRGWGRIVLIASINGLRGKAGQANYAASKAGMIGMARTLARELGRSGVTVNVVAPGMVTTPMTRDLPAEVLETAVRESLTGRIAEPADVADAVAFLCSERARHITGTVLRVDGGQHV
jgi:3-oxoacyl-[acyl-carrier protein] reductase